MDNLKSLQLHQKSLNELFSKKIDSKVLDPCPVCDSELYYGEDLTKRCGLLNKVDDIIGWLCPYCKSEFDVDDNIVEILTNIVMKGKA